MARSAEERNAYLIGVTCGDVTITGFVPRKTLSKPPRLTVHCKCGVDYTLNMEGVKDKLRKDWTATETYVHDATGHGYQSYRVLKCPGFKRG